MTFDSSYSVTCQAAITPVNQLLANCSCQPRHLVWWRRLLLRAGATNLVTTLNWPRISTALWVVGEEPGAMEVRLLLLRQPLPPWQLWLPSIRRHRARLLHRSLCTTTPSFTRLAASGPRQHQLLSAHHQQRQPHKSILRRLSYCRLVSAKSILEQEK